MNFKVRLKNDRTVLIVCSVIKDDWGNYKFLAFNTEDQTWMHVPCDNCVPIY